MKRWLRRDHDELRQLENAVNDAAIAEGKPKPHRMERWLEKPKKAPRRPGLFPRAEPRRAKAKR